MSSMAGLSASRSTRRRSTFVCGRPELRNTFDQIIGCRAEICRFAFDVYFVPIRRRSSKKGSKNVLHNSATFRRRRNTDAGRPANPRIRSLDSNARPCEARYFCTWSCLGQYDNTLPAPIPPDHVPSRPSLSVRRACCEQGWESPTTHAGRRHLCAHAQRVKSICTAFMAVSRPSVVAPAATTGKPMELLPPSS